MLALLLAAAEPRTAIEAEHAFAADAQRIGQWAAFRKWAAVDATMFTPQPTRAQDWLKDRKEPAKAIEWWPTASWVSCDGSLAVNTGGSRRPDGGVGYFTTVWQKQPEGGWRWRVDHGDSLNAPRDKRAAPKIAQASCKGAPKPRLDVAEPAIRAGGASKDGTLIWRWFIWTHGERTVEMSLWNGADWQVMLSDTVLPKP